MDMNTFINNLKIYIFHPFTKGLNLKYFALALLFSVSAQGQADLLTKKGSKFYYQDKKYKCKELDPIYEQHCISFDLYNSGLRLKRCGRINGYVGLGLFALGLGGVVLGAENIVTRGSLNYLGVIGGLSIGASFILEVVAIIQKIRGGHKLKKARRLFNIEMIERHGYKEEVSISFGQTTHGLGIAVDF